MDAVHEREPEAIDPRAARRRFNAAAADESALEHALFLAREAAGRMAERLDYLRISPALIVDAGSGAGRDARMLAGRYPAATVLALDAAPRMARLARDAAARSRSLASRLCAAFGLRRAGTTSVCADMTRLPLAPGACDFLWSNLALPWASDPQAALAEFGRVLAADGLLMFSTYGPDTLAELRMVSRELDGPGSPLSSRVHRFVDMHDLGDMLTRAGFAAPVMDMARLTLTYESPDRLFADLRASGERNVSLSRARGLTGRAAWRRMLAAVERLRRDDGRIAMTVELVFGHAWKGGRKPPSTTADGRSIVRFERH